MSAAFTGEDWRLWRAPASEPAPDPGPLWKEGRPTRIMPLGDSITRGQGNEATGGWRKTLLDALAPDGRSVRQVGWMTDVAPAGFQAVGGWRIKDHLGWGTRGVVHGVNAIDAVRIFNPDTILVHLGTNDVGSGVTANQLADYLMAYRMLLDQAHAFVPAAHVFIARIVLLENRWAGTRTYNGMVETMVTEYVAQGRPYHLVRGMEDMPDGSWADGIHPNAQGYNYMATVWKTALDAAAQT